jgi:hypothetical protein
METRIIVTIEKKYDDSSVDRLTHSTEDPNEAKEFIEQHALQKVTE